MADIFYDVLACGDRFGLECATNEAAEKWADEWWAEQCREENLRNGQVRTETAFIIKYQMTDDGKEDLCRERYMMEYEHYHGDFAEHNTVGR